MPQDDGSANLRRIDFYHNGEGNNEEMLLQASFNIINNQIK